MKCGRIDDNITETMSDVQSTTARMMSDFGTIYVYSTYISNPNPPGRKPLSKHTTLRKPSVPIAIARMASIQRSTRAFKGSLVNIRETIFRLRF